MKSVLFVANSMNIGGVEKALLGVMNKYIEDNWDVSLALLKKDGGFLQYVPAQVKIYTIESFESVKPILHNPLIPQILESLKCLRLYKATRLSYSYLHQKFRRSSVQLYRYVLHNLPKFNQKYDLAVAFAGPDSFIDYFVAHKVSAKEKWGWIHFDVSKFGIDNGIMKDAGKIYKRINVVSEEGKRIFDDKFPELSGKTKFCPNIVDEKFILASSKDPLPTPLLYDSDDKKIILTVGRISREKGQYICLQAIKALSKERTDFCWWFVGDGYDMERCRRYVEDNKLEAFVKFMGAQTNPYPYMANCDIYVQPSLHEGYCITLAEAKLFNKKIISTDFTGAEEQLGGYKYPYRIVQASSDSILDALVCEI